MGLYPSKMTRIPPRPHRRGFLWYGVKRQPGDRFEEARNHPQETVQPGQIDACQSRPHRELLLREIAVGSESLELFAETLNGAHGTLRVVTQAVTRQAPPLKVAEIRQEKWGE